MTAFPEPGSTGDLRGLLLDYLDYFRSVVAGKVTGLTSEELHRSQVPSGWTPAGMLTHLTFMERRWFQWGFMGERLSDPWGDSDGDGWITADGDLTILLDRLHEAGTRTRQIVEAHELTQHATAGGRFESPAEAPQLHWILLHVLQEYARHAGHLDITRELVDGATGEDG
jgi:Protein of unknown function (DUF664)